MGLAVLLGLASCGKAREPLFFDDLPLPSLLPLLNESEYIAVGHVTASDPKAGSLSLHLDRTLKGRILAVDWRMNLSGMKLVCRHLSAGAPVVVFGNSQLVYTYGNRYFFSSYGAPDNGIWSGAQVSNTGNRVFNGPARELAAVVEGCLRGERRPPPLCPSLPKIDDPDMWNLPSWDEGGAEEILPAPFRSGVPLVLSPRPPEKPASTAPGLEYAVYGSRKAYFNEEAPLETGIAPAPEYRSEWKKVLAGVRFHGFVEVPKDGDYSFILRRDIGDAVELTVASTPLDPSEPVPDFVPLLAGKHRITLKCLGAGGDTRFEILWVGPDLPKQPIPESAWSHSR